MKSLNNLPDLEKLTQVSVFKRQLDLSDNSIEDLAPLAKYKELTVLNLGGNQKLKDFKQIEPLKHLKIQVLELAGTPLSEQKDIRAKIFEEFKDLLILD